MKANNKGNNFCNFISCIYFVVYIELDPTHAWHSGISVRHVIISTKLTRIIQSLYYAPAGRYINAWMHSLKQSVKPEIVNRYDLWVLRHEIGGGKVTRIIQSLYYSPASRCIQR